MRIKLPLLAVLALMPALAVAQAPGLGSPVQVTLADGSPIDVGGFAHSAPDYGDVDGDGVPDLVVGQFSDGYIRIYHNYGTATEPVFKNFTLLEAGGEPAVVPPS